ncbi:RNase H domain-containing protein [Trichonephila clavipes]|uniref:RNase H domain-containing protein n=1 Tax=Trichonephila clavipes TaxID=2585209 RepID=A0A8X6W898_TRICX|nr:RNase H domain-containing protein [Trichonephila clavipes]
MSNVVQTRNALLVSSAAVMDVHTHVSTVVPKVIDGIPLDAAKIYTDGRKGETNTTDSGVLIEVPGHVIKFQKRNADHTSVFRTEIIAIMCGLSFINNIRDLAVFEIWILTDSRSSIQHLQNWPSIGDSTSRSLLGNEAADDLAKAATSNHVDPEDHMVLTSTEIYSRAKELICRNWVVPPVHPWYFQKHPGSAISSKDSRSYQTAFSRFSTGHLRCMKFEGGKRNFPNCPICNMSPFSPQNILQSLGFFCEETVASPCCSKILYRFMDSRIWSSETRPDGD